MNIYGATAKEASEALSQLTKFGIKLNEENKTKSCTNCGEEKELTEFCKNKNMKSGLNCWCKSCVGEYNKWYRVRDLVKVRQKIKRSDLWYYLAGFDEEQEWQIKKYCAKNDFSYLTVIRMAVKEFFDKTEDK